MERNTKDPAEVAPFRSATARWDAWKSAHELKTLTRLLQSSQTKCSNSVWRSVNGNRSTSRSAIDMRCLKIVDRI